MTDKNIEINYEKKLQNCNFIKAILMLLVVLYHSCALWKDGGWFNQAPASPSAFLNLLAQWLNSFHVYAFTFLSGYIFWILKHKMGKYQDKKRFILGKVKRLLVPYVLVAAFWAAPWYSFYFKTSFSDVIKAFGLGLMPAQLWFLLMLFWVFVIASILPDSMFESTTVLMIVSVVLYGLGFAGGMICPNILQVFTGCQYFLFFALGCVFAKGIAITGIVKHPLLLVMIDVVLFSVYLFLGTSDAAIYRAARLVIEVILHIAGALMAYSALDWIANHLNERVKNSRVVQVLEKQNFHIYLFHQQIIYAVITHLNGKVPSAALVLLNFSMALIVSLILSWGVTLFPSQ